MLLRVTQKLLEKVIESYSKELKYRTCVEKYSKVTEKSYSNFSLGDVSKITEVFGSHKMVKVFASEYKNRVSIERHSK
jgi:hypothetical protein